jgi:hypothetical protein
MLKRTYIGVICLIVAFSFVGCGKTDEPLVWNEETALRVRQDYFNSNINDAVTLADVEIFSYYGIYNNCIVLVINGHGGYGQAVVLENIAGTDFIYGNVGFVIKVWKDGVFYSLTQAYEDGLLTDEDIGKIYGIRMEEKQ